MTGVHIVTDSSCDLSEAETTTNGIGVVPLNIRFGDDEYIDREQLSVEDFYAKMASTGLLPETSAPSPGRFEQAFRGAAAVGASGVVCINLSGELSATAQSARNAATAAELAATWPDKVSVAQSNQAVVDASSIVCVAVLPSQCSTVLREINFRRDHTVLLCGTFLF